MKTKHNKKRNTAFIFEVLIRELTKTIVKKDDKKKKLIVKLVRENFKGSTSLAKDLELYKAILDTNDLDKHTAEKLVFEARMRKGIINDKQLFKEQTEVIDKINKLVSPDVFSNFIPNYRDVATVYQIFDVKTKTKQRVLMEKQKFGTELLSEQRSLLGHYINSFTDNGLELKIFLNEEISRLRSKLEKAMNFSEIKEDSDLFGGTEKVMEILDGFSKKPIDNDLVQEVLKIQDLVQEIEKR